MYHRDKSGLNSKEHDESFAQAARDMAGAAKALAAVTSSSDGRAEIAALRLEVAALRPHVAVVGHDHKFWHHKHSSVATVASSIIIISALMAAFVSYGFFSSNGGFPVNTNNTFIADPRITPYIITGWIVQRATLLFAAFACFALSLAMALWAKATLFLFYPVVAKFVDRQYQTHTFAGLLTFLAAIWCFIGFCLVFGAFFATIRRASDDCFNSVPYFANGTRVPNDCVTEQGSIAIIIVAIVFLAIIGLMAAIFQSTWSRVDTENN